MTNGSLLAQWRSRLDDFSRSGLTVSAWCASHEIPLHRFYYWRRKVSDTGTVPSASEVDWLSVPFSEPAVTDTLPVRVGGVTIDVAPGFDPALLNAVVAALASRQC